MHIAIIIKFVVMQKGDIKRKKRMKKWVGTKVVYKILSNSSHLPGVTHGSVFVFIYCFRKYCFNSCLRLRPVLKVLEL